MLRKLNLFQNNISDTQTITNLQVEVDEIKCDYQFRISAQLVKNPETNKQIIILHYHADAKTEKRRKQERNQIREFIAQLRIRYKGVTDFVVIGDFNECAYTKTSSNKMILSDKLNEIVSQISDNICQIGLPKESVLKQRGTVCDGNYIGPNMYLNPQALKDGAIVYDSKIMILHYDFSQPEKNFQEMISADSIPQLIKRFDMDDTGGLDHPTSELIVQGIQFVGMGYMSTQNHKSFKKVNELYHKAEFTSEMLTIQIRATKKLYEILACEMLSQEAYQSVNFTCPEAIRIFLTSLNAEMIKESNLQKLEKSIAAWTLSTEFLNAQALLKSPAKIDAKQLAHEAVSSGRSEKVIDTIARRLNGQLCGGFMPRVNGKSSPNNKDIDDMHIKSTLKYIKPDKWIYIVSTEGSKSKSDKFKQDLAKAMYAQTNNVNAAGNSCYSFWKKNLRTLTVLSAGICTGAIVYRLSLS